MQYKRKIERILAIDSNVQFDLKTTHTSAGPRLIYSFQISLLWVSQDEMKSCAHNFVDGPLMLSNCISYCY